MENPDILLRFQELIKEKPLNPISKDRVDLRQPDLDLLSENGIAIATKYLVGLSIDEILALSKMIEESFKTTARRYDLALHPEDEIMFEDNENNNALIQQVKRLKVLENLRPNISNDGILFIISIRELGRTKDYLRFASPLITPNASLKAFEMATYLLCVNYPTEIDYVSLEYFLTENPPTQAEINQIGKLALTKPNARFKLAFLKFLMSMKES